MAASARVRNLEGRKLEGTAGRHMVVMDRKLEDGGTDASCTSGEMLLLAIGSCASGGVRRFLQGRGAGQARFQVDVSFEPSPTGAERDMIRIAVALPAGLLDGGEAALEQEIMAGRVVGRLALGSEMELCWRPDGAGPRD